MTKNDQKWPKMTKNDQKWLKKRPKPKFSIEESRKHESFDDLRTKLYIGTLITTYFKD